MPVSPSGLCSRDRSGLPSQPPRAVDPPCVVGGPSGGRRRAQVRIGRDLLCRLATRSCGGPVCLDGRGDHAQGFARAGVSPVERFRRVLDFSDHEHGGLRELRKVRRLHRNTPGEQRPWHPCRPDRRDETLSDAACLSRHGHARAAERPGDRGGCATGQPEGSRHRAATVSLSRRDHWLSRSDRGRPARWQARRSAPPSEYPEARHDGPGSGPTSLSADRLPCLRGYA